jgi:predicted RNA-binding protein with PUA domain
MKKTMLILSLFTLLSADFISCSYLRGPEVKVLPEHIKKVYVKPVVANQFGVEKEFTDAVEKEMITDGRLSLVNTEEEADVIFVVIVKKYVLQPLIYDDDKNEGQYKLSVKADVSLVDKNKNVIWKEADMKITHVYKDYMRNPTGRIFYDGMSERKAKKAVFNKFSKYIVRRVIK